MSSSSLPYPVRFKLPLQYLSVTDWNNFVRDLLFILQYGPGKWLEYYQNGNMKNLGVVKAKSASFGNLEINGYQALWNLKPVQAYTFPVVLENWLSDLQSAVNKFNEILEGLQTIKIPVYTKAYVELSVKLTELLTKFKYKLYTVYLETFPNVTTVSGLQATISGSINLASLVPTIYADMVRYVLIRNLGTSPIEINNGIYLMPNDVLRVKIADVIIKNVGEVTLLSTQQVPFGVAVSGMALPTTRTVTPPLYAITIQNSQSDPTPAPFQVLLQLNLQGVLSSASVPNLLSLLFCQDQSCSTPLYAWIESYTSDLSSVYIWVLLPDGIPASSSVTIYMQVTNQIQYPWTGIAPQLTATYAQYDNASNIFPYYQRWGGLSSLPSGWGMYDDTVITYGSDYIQIGPGSTTYEWYGIYLETDAFQNPVAWDFYGNMYATNSNYNWVGTYSSETGDYGYGFCEEGVSPNTLYIANGGSCIEFETSYEDTNTNKVYTIYNNGSYVSALINYNNVFSTSDATSETPDYFEFTIYAESTSSSTVPITVYWLRTRALPPNGVMPSVTSFTKIS